MNNAEEGRKRERKSGNYWLPLALETCQEINEQQYLTASPCTKNMDSIRMTNAEVEERKKRKYRRKKDGRND